ncbi:hypothetical protein SAMN04488026_10082 [Aliiruegeria lutimaris]|uniref:Uncharacterized protein n=1 Tax=Aliiruegeria lutimaris TaxID=571298 RepID=A0A1G8NW74_9RHOB|nr:hypothetical protein SAMN04488026_10082 [Aliiruegeria lutimaris]
MLAFKHTFECCDLISDKLGSFFFGMCICAKRRKGEVQTAATRLAKDKRGAGNPDGTA